MNFKELVIKITKSIPYGCVTTYGTIATLSGMPRGARLVGGILHFAYQKEDLPWHRVINREGFISIRCMDHPKELQKALLEQEGVKVSKDLTIDLSTFGWWGEDVK
ncbi:MAG: Methylated-DNA/protein-cysteine methyltransferase [Candidatus Daviesbacteria bacterium GW2011_GWA2_38_24]|uniref:Methylated-DNA/protein-cysteine methyltransferase n=1 Tax=Candidatus Daviesbacteria bacterium GW2011_GWA2_38_24 TaxID=1618422 RepID=A0A0G0JWI1_9BACT|nr:MAG: Methylated-DNA/protein-cysteine methyltransferase [Candidatus Daviesbacteria bacterium GW2011_GWA2_38_24]